MRGYHDVIGRYWAAWSDTMGTRLMVREGACEADGSCTFTGPWTDPVTKQLVTSRMTSPTTAVLERARRATRPG